MSNEKKSWSRILGEIDTKTRVMALIALVIEAALFATLAFLPAEHIIFGLIICAAVLVVLAVGIVRVELAETKANATSRKEAPVEERTDQTDTPYEAHHSEERQSDENLVARLVEKLRDKRFDPDLIVAIARGGLIAAGYLSKQLTKQPFIPVISLWRTKEGDADYNNSFNHIAFDREELGLTKSGEINILIVDGFCVRGRTLKVAEEYVKRSINSNDVKIKTAAAIFQTDIRCDRETQTRPSFVGLETEERIYAFGETERK